MLLNYLQYLSYYLYILLSILSISLMRLLLLRDSILFLCILFKCMCHCFVSSFKDKNCNMNLRASNNLKCINYNVNHLMNNLHMYYHMLNIIESMDQELELLKDMSGNIHLDINNMKMSINCIRLLFSYKFDSYCHMKHKFLKNCKCLKDRK